MLITVKQLVELLSKCPANCIVEIWTEDDRDYSVQMSALQFVENCSSSQTVRLLNYKPKLVNTKHFSVELKHQEECFAETKYYDTAGRRLGRDTNSRNTEF